MVKKIQHFFVKIIELNCDAETTKIHGYRTQIITDIPVYLKNTKLIYNNCRYECKLCHKSFYKNNSIVNKYDGKTYEVVDILECRHKHFLCDYFKRFLKSELDNVKYFVTDLWEHYKDIAFTYFRKISFLICIKILEQKTFKVFHSNY